MEGALGTATGADAVLTSGTPIAGVCPKFTTGAADAAILASNISRLVKPKGPARITPGKVWMALL